MAADKVAGDADAALAGAAHVVDRRYETPAQHHNPIELIGALAEWRGDALTVRLPSQGVEAVRHGLAVQLGLAPDRIRVVSELVGGGFGQLFVQHGVALVERRDQAFEPV